MPSARLRGLELCVTITNQLKKPYLQHCKTIVNSYLELVIIDKDFHTALNCFEREAFFKKLVAFTTDRALLRYESPCFFFFIWYVFLCLELALLIENFSFKMFYLYHKDPKKLWQLKELCEIFKKRNRVWEGRNQITAFKWQTLNHS